MCASAGWSPARRRAVTSRYRCAGWQLRHLIGTQIGLLLELRIVTSRAHNDAPMFVKPEASGLSCAILRVRAVLGSELRLVTGGLPRCRLLPPLAAPPGRSSSLRCGRTTGRCGFAGGGMAAIEECLGLPPARACSRAKGGMRPGRKGGDGRSPAGGHDRPEAGRQDRDEPRSGTLLSGQAWPRVRPGEEHWLASGRQIVIRTAPAGVSADYRARPAARIGDVRAGAGGGRPPGRCTA